MMDLERLVDRARQSDVKAFVELAQRFQHLAFMSTSVAALASMGHCGYAQLVWKRILAVRPTLLPWRD
jgi:hypothetical protein